VNACNLAMIFLAVASAALAAPSVPDASKTGTSPQFPSEVALVTVDAVVLDGDGNPVRGLTRDDFLISEESKPQAVVSFEAVEAGPAITKAEESREDASAEPSVVFAPVSTNVARKKDVGRTFVIVFDGTHLTPSGATRAKESTARFIKEGMREGDSVSLLSTANGAWWTGTGLRGRERLLQLLKDLRGERVDLMPAAMHITDDEARRVVEYHDRQVAGAIWRRMVEAGVTIDYAQANRGQANPGNMADGSSQEKSANEWLSDHPEVENWCSTLYDVMQKRRTVVVKMLQRVFESLTTKRGRKSLLLVSEGFVGDAATTGYKELVETARRANTAVYFLDARGLLAAVGDMASDLGQISARDTMEAGFIAQGIGSSAIDLDADSDGADRLASDTGGFSVKHTNDLTKGFDKINRESTAYYLIGYYPSDERHDGSYRKISVSVSRKNVQVRARKGYYAPEPSGKRRRDPEEKTDPALPVLQRALDAPFSLDGIRLRASAYVLDNASPTQANVVVATDIDIRDLAFDHLNDRYVDRVSFLVVLLNMQSGERFRSNQKIEMRLLKKTREGFERTWYPVITDLQVPAGPYQAKVVVVDENNSRVGSVAHEFGVPETSGWRVSTPVLSDTLALRKEGSAPRPIPLARRSFQAQGRLFCQFAVYGAATRENGGGGEVVAGFVLQDAGGREIFRGEPAAIQPDSSGGLTRIIGLPLNGLAPGEYSLLLTIEDRVSAKRYERSEPLTIEPAGS
jgi:VWFA-related protein